MRGLSHDRSRGSGLLFSHHCTHMQIFFILISHDNIACEASVSSRVMARKLEREQKKKKGVEGGWGSRLLLPRHSFFFFFCSRPNFSWRTRAETLATQANRLLTQANDNSTSFHRAQGQHAKRRPLPPAPQTKSRRPRFRAWDGCTQYP